MSLWIKAKKKKLQSLVMASVLTFSLGMVNNVYADGIIGQGDYSWDKDWSISLSSNHQLGGGSGSSVSSSIRYRASTGLLYIYRHYVSESDAGTDDSDSWVTLGDARSILDGITADDVQDIIDDKLNHDTEIGFGGVDTNGDGQADRPGNLEVAGDTTTNGDNTTKGDSTTEGNETIKGDETVEGDETVKGDSSVEGDQTVGGDLDVGFDGVDENGDGTPDRPGDLNVAGDSNVDGDGHFDGDVTIGNRDEDGNATDSSDLDATGNGNIGGDMNVGYDGVDDDGDGTPDRPGDLNVAGNGHVEGDLTVDGNSDLKGDTTVGERDDEGNITDYSDFDVTGNTNLGGDTEVGFDGVDENGDGNPDRYGNLDVAGDTTVGIRDDEGNVEQASDLDVTGNSNLGGDTNIGYDGVDEDGDGVADRPGDLNVAGDSHLTGDTQVGSRDDEGNVTDYSDFDVTGSANVGGDAYVGYDGVDENGDGTPDRPGNMYIAGDTVIGVPGVPGAESNLHVTGNTNIDHDLYVGGEGHFDGNIYAPDLIFNGGKSLTGEISRLDGRIDTAGANAAALAGLHPLDFDEDQKLNFVASVGSYQGASAMALGMFYRPDDRTMFNIGGTFGNRENMATLGVSFALDGPNAVKRSSKKQMQEQIVMLTAANAAMAEDNAEMQAELAELKAIVMELKAEQTAESN